MGGFEISLQVAIARDMHEARILGSSCGMYRAVTGENSGCRRWAVYRKFKVSMRRYSLPRRARYSHSMVGTLR